jgi:hypothetical protein
LTGGREGGRIGDVVTPGACEKENRAKEAKENSLTTKAFFSKINFAAYLIRRFEFLEN